MVAFLGCTFPRTVYFNTGCLLELLSGLQKHYNYKYLNTTPRDFELIGVEQGPVVFFFNKLDVSNVQ